MPNFPFILCFLAELLERVFYSTTPLNGVPATSQLATNWMLSYRATASPGSPKTSSCHNRSPHF